LLSPAVVSVLVSLVVNYSLKVVELLSLLLAISYVVDLMICVILVLCMIYHVYSAYFGGSPSEKAVKRGSGKINKILITDEYKGPRVSCRSPPGPHIFIGLTDEYMVPPVRSPPRAPVRSPTNVIRYICRFHVTDEYIVTFVGTDE
jgi:hypothetical protein